MTIRNCYYHYYLLVTIVVSIHIHFMYQYHHNLKIQIPNSQLAEWPSGKRVGLVILGSLVVWVVSLSKKLYTNCSVLVASRNGLESVSITKSSLHNRTKINSV